MEVTELSQQAGDLAELHLLASGQMQKRHMRTNERLCPHLDIKQGLSLARTWAESRII
jgi:DNA-binding Xre family transcriptional regulator